MYTNFYEKISAPWKKMPNGAHMLSTIDAILRVVVAVEYALLLLRLATTQDARLTQAILVPLATFVVVSIIRNGLNKQRPYEVYSIKPLINKSALGKSMPSRHMASATIIAATFLWISTPAGICGLILCAAIAYVRIAGGVHFPRDIIAAFVFALACAALGFLVF